MEGTQSSLFFEVNKKLTIIAYESIDNCSNWLIMFSNLWVASNQEHKNMLLSAGIKALKSERLL